MMPVLCQGRAEKRREDDGKEEFVCLRGNWERNAVEDVKTRGRRMVLMDNIQENFLTQLVERNMPVTLFLVNGFQYRGVIRDFDKFTISIEAEGNQFLIFKKMVSTIQTQSPVIAM